MDIHNHFRSLDELIRGLDREKALRESQASESGNSKLRMRRSFPGFLVNSYEAIDARLNGKHCFILPEEGSSVFVSDWERFVISSDVTVRH